MNDLTPEEAELGEWIAARCTELGIACTPDYRVSDTRWPAYLPNFGGVNGMLVGSMECSYPESGSLYRSLLNPVAYLGTTKETLMEALNDWGWFGSIEDRPAWYNGVEGGGVAQPFNPADA